MTSNTKSYLLDYEIEGEAERIDWQHQLDVQTCGLFPRWINTKELGAIADVATGTGYTDPTKAREAFHAKLHQTESGYKMSLDHSVSPDTQRQTVNTTAST